MSELFFKGNPQLETERLILRKLVSEDVKDIYAYASNDEVSKYMSWDTHKSIEDSKGFINFVLGKYEKDEAGEWGIVLKETGKLIGSTGCYQYSKQNSCAELGYAINRSHWGKGIMPEAVNGVLKFAFEEMGLNRIECYHYVLNEKSGRVMQKVGMTYEGTARGKIYAKGMYCDVKQYAILKKDWEKKVSV